MLDSTRNASWLSLVFDSSSMSFEFDMQRSVVWAHCYYLTHWRDIVGYCQGRSSHYSWPSVRSLLWIWQHPLKWPCQAFCWPRPAWYPWASLTVIVCDTANANSCFSIWWLRWSCRDWEWQQWVRCWCRAWPVQVSSWWYWIDDRGVSRLASSGIIVVGTSYSSPWHSETTSGSCGNC